MKKQRLLKLLRTGLVLLCAGLLYAFLTRRLGFGVPCPVYALTGLRCPGCGVSRMCLALLRLDLPLAFRCNRCVFVLLPAFAYIAVRGCVGYARTGERMLHGSAKAVGIACIAALLLFGAVRNFLGW